MKYLSNSLIGTFVLLLFSCTPNLHIITNTVHPDSDKNITFTVSKGKIKEEVTEVKLEIEGNLVATQNGSTLTYTGGPYPAYSNRKLNYKATAKTSSGKTASSSDWLYIANPKGVYSSPVPNGSNDGYPNSTAEQTGANLYRLDRRIVRATAQDALMEYANNQNTLVRNIINIADELVAAVAFYVDAHMSWRSDSINRIVFTANGWASYTPGWDHPQPADLTLTISGNLTNAAPRDDYMGDCEDHAILRAALLRALGFAPWAIWNAIDYQPDLTPPTLTHEYNIVLYQGAYRIMDYGRIARYLNKHTWASHMSHYGWNQDNGPRGATSVNHDFLKNQTNNFPGGKLCLEAWSFNKYYRSNCF